ncbi:MAG: hypothetical protein AABY54_01030 [Deltaproteobacteria bacterium]|mgnify:FL=1
MGRLKSQRGSFSLGSLIFIAVIGTGIYVGIMMGIPWIKFYEVEQLFKDQAIRLKIAQEEEVKGAIKAKLASIDVPLSIDDVQITREEGKPAVIKGTYKTDVDFAGVYKYTYIFKPRGEAPKSGGLN